MFPVRRTLLWRKRFVLAAGSTGLAGGRRCEQKRQDVPLVAQSGTGPFDSLLHDGKNDAYDLVPCDSLNTSVHTTRASSIYSFYT